MLSDEHFDRLAAMCTPNTETGSLNYRMFGQAIEAEVRKSDEALIRQLVDALENLRDHGFSWDPAFDAPIAAGRARLEGKP